MAQRQFRSDDTSIWTQGFGDGSDGAYSPSTSTDSTPNTTANGTVGTTALTVGSGSGFSANMLVLIHQSREGGGGPGAWELNKISSVGGGTNWTMAYTLMNTYAEPAQVIQLKQYSSVNIAGGVTLTSQLWSVSGHKGGLLAFLCTSTTTVAGVITASARGYWTSNEVSTPQVGRNGEGTIGAGGSGTLSNNGNGGGGGSANTNQCGGAGAGNGVAGSGGGGGSGGSILLKGQTISLGTNKLTVASGGGSTSSSTGDGGAGAVGRIHVDYSASLTGTATPTIDSRIDSILQELPIIGDYTFFM